MRYVITFLFFCFFFSISIECAKLCTVDEHGNPSDNKSLCCRKKNGEIVRNKSNPRSKQVICCPATKDSYSSLVSRAHGLNNEIVSKQKEITRLNNERSSINARGRRGELTDKQVLEEHDKIDAKISKLSGDIKKRRARMEGYLERSRGLESQVQGIEHLKHLTNLPGKLTGTSCVRGNGKGCL